MATILLVEDNELNRDMLARRLARKAYVVDIAENGKSALEAVALDRPDIILLDMSIPVIDGWVVTKQLKADPETAHIPIIALTAHAMTEDRRKALEAGCDEYVSKPVDFSELLEKIESLLGDRT
ncbi:MAG: response regulator [Candidatus Marinimicrobia bacterium]|nr:response regulator [Candidatus Neomarinimicrobiota bacterium]